MERTIKVHYATGQTKEVSIEEATRILHATYTDPLGGIVADGKTNTIIFEIGPDVKEILVLEMMIGGG